MSHLCYQQPRGQAVPGRAQVAACRMNEMNGLSWFGEKTEAVS